MLTHAPLTSSLLQVKDKRSRPRPHLNNYSISVGNVPYFIMKKKKSVQTSCGSKTCLKIVVLIKAVAIFHRNIVSFLRYRIAIRIPVS